jgi:Eukaryotic cytochrome b561
MLDLVLIWLSQPLDPSRAHLVDSAVTWHGRLMVVAWGFLLPLGVLIARFFKILPRQHWPDEIDNRVWWRSHLVLQYVGGLMMLAGLGSLVTGGHLRGATHVHGLLGYAVVALGVSQFLAGWLRGSKGGPTEPEVRGDHYDMTPRRRVFETFHKATGYAALLLACAAILTGLWQANAPRWMGLLLIGWWLLFVAAYVLLQTRGRAIDTYQAIWGPDRIHPGNTARSGGWGMRRLAAEPGEKP